MYKQDIPFRKRLALELILQGEPNFDIAGLIGVAHETVCAWAKAHGFRVRSPTRKSAQHHRAEALLLLGLRNHEVAEALGVCTESVKIWRAKAGLPRLPKDPPSKGPRRRRGEELFLLGWRDSEVAEDLGVSRGAAQQWRVAAGIPTQPPDCHPRQDEIDTLLRQGLPCTEIARRVKASISTVSQRRKTLDLPPGGQVKDDLGGRCFGRLTAIEIDRTRTTRRIKWRCLCTCGRIVSILRGSLLLGLTRSCGCLKRDFYLHIQGRRAPWRPSTPETSVPGSCRSARRGVDWGELSPDVAASAGNEGQMRLFSR